MILHYSKLASLWLVFSIAACSNAETSNSRFSMDYPDWEEMPSDDPLNVVSMTSPDRRCFFYLNASPAPVETYQEALENYVKDRGARILSADPISFEIEDGNYTLLAKTNSVYCEEKTNLAIVSCIKNSYDHEQASRIFSTMRCGGAGSPDGVAAITEPVQSSSDESSGSETVTEEPGSERPLLGMIISPEGEFSHVNVTNAYKLAKQNGVQITLQYFSWTDVETGRGRYNWKDSDYMIGRARAEDMRLSVAFHTVRTAIKGPRPADLKTHEWQDPELIERFSDMVLAFLDRYEDLVDYIEVGTEVNAYFQWHEDEIEPYRVFFDEVRRNIKEKYPNVSVGILFAYRELKESNTFAIYEQLNIGDHDGFTLYTFGDNYAHTKSPRLIFEGLKEIAQLTGDRKFVLEEVGWIASPLLGGNESSQREAVKFFFDYYEQAPERLEFMSWYSLHDLQEKDCDKIARTFSRPGDGLSRDPEQMNLLSHFICNFGLRKNDGTPRPAWDEWVKRVRPQNEN